MRTTSLVVRTETESLTTTAQRARLRLQRRQRDYIEVGRLNGCVADRIALLFTIFSAPLLVVVSYVVRLCEKQDYKGCVGADAVRGQWLAGCEHRKGCQSRCACPQAHGDWASAACVHFVVLPAAYPCAEAAATPALKRNGCGNRTDSYRPFSLNVCIH